MPGRPRRTDDIARAVVEDLRTTDLRICDIAKKYSLRPGHVEGVASGKLWPELTGGERIRPRTREGRAPPPRASKPPKLPRERKWPRNQAEFVSRSKGQYGDRFDYSAVVYTTCLKNVTLKCLTCDTVFDQRPIQHLLGSVGCKCPKSWSLTQDQFLARVRQENGDAYDLSEVVFRTTKDQVTVTCRKCGIRQQRWAAHLLVRGGRLCPYCAEWRTRSRHTTESFIQRAREVHGPKYDYSSTEYGQNNEQPVEIVCPRHGSFFQKPVDHIAGSGCRPCTANVSRVESAWLDHFNVKDRQKRYPPPTGTRHKGWYVVDGLDEENKIAYEFLGGFYHGDPAIYDRDRYNQRLGCTYGDLLEEARTKIRRLREWGFEVIYVWEKDYLEGLLVSDRDIDGDDSQPRSR